MKMIDVSESKSLSGESLCIAYALYAIGWASNDDSTYNIVDFGAKGDE